MVKQTQAAVLYGAKDLRVIYREVADPAPGEAQIAIKATGLCGSDLHYFIHGKNGEYVLREPMALGHESAGEVVSVGEGVTSVKVGDRVAIEAGVYCKSCRLCKLGRYNLCPKMRFASSAKVFPHADGHLQTYFNHPIDFLHPIADSTTYEEASLVEPLSVVIQAARRAHITAGQKVLVLGAGAVGLLGSSVSSAYGSTFTCVVDINKDRVDFAVKEAFATKGYVLPVGPRPSSAEESLAKARETATAILEEVLPGGDGFDVVLECTGVESCMQTAIHCARSGGTVVYIGMGTPNPTIPLSAAAFREVNLIGVFRYANTYPDALALLGSGKLPNTSKLVTTRFKLGEAVEAFECLAKGKDAQGNLIMKLMIGDY